MAPQSGHVSNFGGIKRGPLEPAELPHLLANSQREGTGIHAGCPSRTSLELSFYANVRVAIRPLVRKLNTTVRGDLSRGPACLPSVGMGAIRPDHSSRPTEFSCKADKRPVLRGPAPKSRVGRRQSDLSLWRRLPVCEHNSLEFHQYAKQIHDASMVSPPVYDDVLLHVECAGALSLLAEPMPGARGSCRRLDVFF